MCGRFALGVPASQIIEQFELNEDLENIERKLEQRYDVRPSEQILAIVSGSSEKSRKISFFKWGHQFKWTKGLLFNARKEKLSESKFWRKSYQERRSIIPASAFYEWQEIGKKKRQPWEIKAESGEILGMAAIWNEIVDKKSGEIIEWCSVITTEACSGLREIHNHGPNRHRQPAIINRENYNKWLDSSLKDFDELAPLLLKLSTAEFEMRRLKAIGSDKTRTLPVYLEE